jgi:hypothetical protein
VGALAADRQALAVTQAAVAAQVHQTLDVHRDFAAQVALDGQVGVDVFADRSTSASVSWLTRRARSMPALADLFGVHRADAVM